MVLLLRSIFGSTFSIQKLSLIQNLIEFFIFIRENLKLVLHCQVLEQFKMKYYFKHLRYSFYLVNGYFI